MFSGKRQREKKPPNERKSVSLMQHEEKAAAARIKIKEEHFDAILEKGQHWRDDFALRLNAGTDKEKSQILIDYVDTVLEEGRRLIRAGEARSVSIWRFARKPGGGVQPHCISTLLLE